MIVSATDGCNSPSMNWPNDTCDHYWEHADWLPPWYILDRLGTALGACGS